MLGLLPGAAPALAAAPPPFNFIFILVDDLGATDLGCQGSSFYETPNIDRLAREGMRFTQAYSACTVCSPTRAAVLTGQYPARLHITDWIAGHPRPFAKLKVPDWTRHLPLETMNVARALKVAGYVSASIGKWHLGEEAYWPDKQGFDRNRGGCHLGQPPTYVAPYRIPTLAEGPPGELLTDRECAEALKFIEENRNRPFLVYLPHYAVHTPLMGKPEVIAKYKAKARPDAPQRNATYAALVESVDDSVGRLMRRLDELQLAERTVILFTSDNGGLIGNPRDPITANLGLRAGKGSAYEGGVRVPLIVRWPGVTSAGSVCEVPVISVDFFPTLLEAAGVPLPDGHRVDGESLVPLLRGTNVLRRDTLYWHYPHYHPGGATPYSALRQGNWKLIEFFEDDRVELYNLRTDPTERSDLAERMPEKASSMRNQLQAWRRRLGAQLPTPNPGYDPVKDRSR